jgi:hypothetical protein
MIMLISWMVELLYVLIVPRNIILSQVFVGFLLPRFRQCYVG